MKLFVRKNKFGFSAVVNNKSKAQAQNEAEIATAYLDLTFKTGEEPKAEASLIQVDDCFFSAYKNKSGENKLKLVIMAYQVLSTYENNKPQTDNSAPISQQPVYAQPSNDFQTVAVDDDLPF